MSPLTPAGLSHLIATFRRIDDLLAEVETDLAPEQASRLFPTLVPDAAPVQHRLICGKTRRARKVMRDALARFDAIAPPPRISAIWTARTRVMAACVAAAELAPEHMRRRDPLAGDAERGVRMMASELSDLFEQMESYLAQGSNQMMHARLQRLAGLGADTRLLGELERIVSAHALAECRPALERLAAHLASGELEVDVFGRVNAGKSSLLNHLLNTSVLPMGVTPVTGVPIRIVYGKEPGGLVSFADAYPEIFDLGRLAEFGSERQNPTNDRHVSALTVQIPSPLLQPSIAFVDTPAAETAWADLTAETVAHLSTCDFGIVLVDASSTMSETDLALLDALLHTGAQALVLLSKADALNGQDLQRAINHAQQQLATRFQAELTVHAVSVRGPSVALCDHWLEAVLAPRLRDHRALVMQVSERKMGLLWSAVRTALEQRLLAIAGETDVARQERLRKIDRMLGQAHALLDTAEHTTPPEIEWLVTTVPQALDEAAHNAAVIWNERHDPSSDVTGLIEASIQSRAGVAAAAIARQIAELRLMLSAALLEAHGEALACVDLDWAPGDDLPRSGIVPLLDGASVVPRTVLHRPALAFAGVSILKHSVLEQVKANAIERHITDSFVAYGQRLEAWRRSMIEVLRSAFAGQYERVPKPDPPGASRASHGVVDALEAIQADLQQLDGLGREVVSHSDRQLTFGSSDAIH